jgi:hypothetical protein
MKLFGEELIPLSTAKLIELALIEEARDEDVRNDPLVVLHERGTREVLYAALELCRSENPKRRDLGAKILGELGHPRQLSGGMLRRSSRIGQA